LAGSAAAQSGGFGNPAPAGYERNLFGNPELGTPMTRADGSFIAISPAGREEAPAGAISFRHYAHKPNKNAVGNFSKALKAVHDNNEGEALDRLADALRVDPDFFEAHLQAGIIWINAEAPERALAHLERALAIDSSSQAAQALSAWALLQLGRHSEAELALRRSMQLGRSLPVFEELLHFARHHKEYAAIPSKTTP
jgi:tetratricopeptide (TPR) repeat protein